MAYSLLYELRQGSFRQFWDFVLGWSHLIPAGSISAHPDSTAIFVVGIGQKSPESAQGTAFVAVIVKGWSSDRKPRSSPLPGNMMRGREFDFVERSDGFSLNLCQAIPNFTEERSSDDSQF